VRGKGRRAGANRPVGRGQNKAGAGLGPPAKLVLELGGAGELGAAATKADDKELLKGTPGLSQGEKKLAHSVVPVYADVRPSNGKNA
jgi:hypothetical protein